MFAMPLLTTRSRGFLWPLPSTRGSCRGPGLSVSRGGTEHSPQELLLAAVHFPECLDPVLIFLGMRPLLLLFFPPAECSPGWYGHNCERPCKCKNGGVCDITTGTCHCPPGYIGADCSIGECGGERELPGVPRQEVNGAGSDCCPQPGC